MKTNIGITTILCLALALIFSKSEAVADGFVWHPEGSEYSVEFPSKGVESNSETTSNGISIQSVGIEYMEKGLYSRADFTKEPEAYLINKNIALENVKKFSREFGLDPFTTAIDRDVRGDVRVSSIGSRMFNVKGVNVLFRVQVIMLYGSRSSFSVVVAVPASEFPSWKGTGILDSVKKAR